jgi:hypothetical protein
MSGTRTVFEVNQQASPFSGRELYIKQAVAGEKQRAQSIKGFSSLT